MSDKKQNHIADMEAKLAHLKANHVDTPAQAKARGMITPVFIALGLIITLVVVALVISAATQQTPEVVMVSENPTPIPQNVDTKDAEKWQAYQSLSDCQLAWQMYNDYGAVIATLFDQVVNYPNLTHQQLVQWQQSSKYNEKIDALDEKYPAHYKVSMTNSLMAHGFSFSAGQLWRDFYFAARQGKPLVSEQVTLMKNDLDLLKANCPNEFGK